MSLSLSKLENVRSDAGGWQAACPVCRKQGHDSTGNHLRIWKSGRWSCVVAPGDADHNRGIWSLAGDGQTGDWETAMELPQIEMEEIWKPDCLDRLIKDHSYWEKRGISTETVEHFQAGVATSGYLEGRSVFPIFNDDGDIIGFSGRCLRDMTPAERKQFKRVKWKHKGPSSKFLWGGLEEIRQKKRAVLIESIGDGLKLREHGIPENLCLFGLVMSETVLGFLIATDPDEIDVSTNRDLDPTKGQESAEKIRSQLLHFFDEDVIKIVHPPEGVKDWGEASKEQIHTAFIDFSLDTESKSETV